jgi:hypothetical protein
MPNSKKPEGRGILFDIKSGLIWIKNVRGGKIYGHHRFIDNEGNIINAISEANNT